MLQGGNPREVANPLDMVIPESDDYVLFEWNNLRFNID